MAKKPAPTDWHWEDIKAALRKTGTNLTKLSAAHGYKGHALQNVTRHCWPKAERIIAEGAPEALIVQHIEPQVVEVYGEGAPAWAEHHGRAMTERCETTGETIFCYTHDPAPLIADLDARNSLRYLHRRASLEDVFLKLTGRELRD